MPSKKYSTSDPLPFNKTGTQRKIEHRNETCKKLFHCIVKSESVVQQFFCLLCHATQFINLRKFSQLDIYKELEGNMTFSCRL
jgi:hypothetical protein